MTVGDLSDVIGRAIGGEEGDTVDYFIDLIRRYVSGMQNRKWSDTEVVEAILYSAVGNLLRNHQLQFLTDVSERDLMEMIDKLQNEMQERKMMGHRMEE